MTQPAMSQHLASLEAEVGEKLSVRMARKMIPTERGKLLYSEAAPLVEALEKVSADLKTASNLHMILRLVGSGAGLSVVPACMRGPANAGDVRIVYEHLSVRNET